MRLLAIDAQTYEGWRTDLRRVTLSAEALARPEQAARLVPGRRTQGAVAVIPISGFISQKPSFFSMLFGGTSTVGLTAAVREAMADATIGAVILAVDSPGGEVFGVPEAARAIRELRGGKPLVSVVDPIAASAAYYLASQADEVVITPSGLAGSVGTFVVHIDDSAFLERAGFKVEVFRAPERKAEGVEGPLPTEARESLQAMVDEFTATFEQDVAKGRKVPVEKVRQDFGRGAVMTASQAVRAGLADRQGTLDQVIAELARGRKVEAAPEPAKQDGGSGARHRLLALGAAME